MGKVFLPKWIEIYNELPAVSISTLTKLDITFSHVWNVIQELEAAGLVKTELEGRVRSVKLTQKGSTLQQHTFSLQNWMERNGMMKSASKKTSQAAH